MRQFNSLIRRRRSHALRSSVSLNRLRSVTSFMNMMNEEAAPESSRMGTEEISATKVPPSFVMRAHSMSPVMFSRSVRATSNCICSRPSGEKKVQMFWPTSASFEGYPNNTGAFRPQSRMVPSESNTVTALGDDSSMRRRVASPSLCRDAARYRSVTSIMYSTTRYGAPSRSKMGWAWISKF